MGHGGLGSLGPYLGLGWGAWVPKAGGSQPRETLGLLLRKLPSLQFPGACRGQGTCPRSRSWEVAEPQCKPRCDRLQAQACPPLDSFEETDSPGTRENGIPPCVSPVTRSWGIGWRVGQACSRELNDVVHKGDDGGPLRRRVLINKPTGAVFGHNELWRGAGTRQARGPGATLCWLGLWEAPL